MTAVMRTAAKCASSVRGPQVLGCTSLHQVALRASYNCLAITAESVNVGPTEPSRKGGGWHQIRLLGKYGAHHGPHTGSPR